MHFDLDNSKRLPCNRMVNHAFAIRKGYDQIAQNQTK